MRRAERAIRILGLILMAGALTSCETTPDPADTTGPTITLSQVSPGEVEVFESTDPEVVIDSPEPCSDGRLLIGTFRQVSGFPIDVLVTGADDSGVEWLRLNARKGVLSSADPPSVSVTTVTVSGVEVGRARADYSASDPRTARLFTVTVTPRPGETIVELEGGAADFNGNDVYTFTTQVGTNEALCEAF